MFKKINNIYKELKKYADEYKIVSRIELKEKIKELLQEFSFNEEEKNLLNDKFELPPINYLFLGCINETPDSIYAPSLTERKTYKDLIFFHGHTFKTNDKIMKEVAQRVYKFKEGKMISILINFLKKSGFNTKITPNTSKNKIEASKDNSKIKVLIYPSVIFLENELKKLNIEENSVFSIPTGGNPGPYLNFYKVFANRILLENAFVWVVDIEDESISPLIGNSKDPAINSNFKSSDLARYAQRIIGMEIDEDF